MTVFVTGGTGFVGSHLIEQLSQAGDTVLALVRQASADEYVRSLGAIPIRGDLDDPASLERVCDGCEVVYHCAAKVELYGREKEFHETNVAGTRRLVEAAGRSGVRRFVHVSSCAVYLNNFSASVVASGKLIDETTPIAEPPGWYQYGRAKYHAEQTVRACCPASMEWSVVRLGHIYGPRDRRTKVYLEAALNDRFFRIVGDGSNEMALVYVEDAVRAIVLVGYYREAGGKIFVVGPSEPCTQQAYINAMADGFGLPRPTRHLNLYIAFCLSWLGEYIVRSGPRRTWLCRPTIAILGLPAKISCDCTRKVLGWEPKVTLTEGMKRAFEWYSAEYGKTGTGA
jgi:nucleoside-diphosphate-sugar epimerase